MKKFIIATAMALFGLAATAATADELRVYINPGHGSWTANDRPMPIKGHGPYSRYNTDTLSFFESNTNLRKGFGVLEKLREFGLKYNPELNQTGERWQIGAARDMSNNIVMSHVKCGPYHDDNGTKNQLGANTPEDLEYYNRSLSEICMEVDANNFDMFISIHSNAVDNGGWRTTNFPIVLYRGYDDCHAADGIDVTHTQTSKAMAQAVWPYHMANIHEGWTAYSTTNPNIRGDLNFYGSGSISRGYMGYLGVLKHGVPGFLIEGYFHQYAPAALRHMNWDADYVEGYNYAHGIADFFGLTKESTGDIYGIVRDEHERYHDDDYVPLPTHDDLYKPLDAVTVTLLKGTETIATYTTDNQFNGVFVFKNVAPGEYKLHFEAEGYKTPKDVDVTVAAAEVSYPKGFMESESYVPPTVTYVDYPDPFEGTMFGARDEYNFEQKVADKEIAELAGYTVQRVICHDGKLFILGLDAENAAKIVVLDAATLEILATPGTAGTEGSVKNLSDIAVSADGILIGSAKELCHYDDSQVEAGETRGVANFYRWTNNEDGLPEGDPALWMTTQLSANMYRAWTGETIAYTGTMAEGRLFVTSQNAYNGGTHRVWYNVLEVIDGAKSSESFRNKGIPDYFDTYENLGFFRLNISPRDSKYFVMDGAGTNPAEVNIDDIENAYTVMPEGVLAKGANNEGFFRYSGHSYMVAPDYTEAGNGGVILLDITEGMDKAVVVPTANTSMEVAEGEAFAVGTPLATVDELGDVKGANMVLFLVRGNKITRFSTEGVAQPQPHREFAYGITVAQDGDNYTVAYNATGNAPASAVVLTNTENGETVEIPGEAVAKGENSITFGAEEVLEGTYNVAVKIVSKNIPEAGIYYSDNNGVTKRGGVVSITDPEAATLGYTVVTTGGACGVKVYAPDGTVSGPFMVNDPRLQASNQSSMFRGDQRDGKAIFADWSDGGAGYWIVDPLNPSDMSQLLAGERTGTDGPKGSYTYNGTIIGGGSSCIGIQGKGENTRIYSFLEDYPAGNTAGAQNRVYAYNIGTDEQITRIPDQAYDNLAGNSLMPNQNVEVKAISDNAFISSQCRSAGNNLASTPSFVIVANDGEVLVNSGSLEYINSSNSGIAVSADGKLLAVGQYDCISIIDVAWDGIDPVLTHKYDIPTGHCEWSHMSFDAGGNLHVYMREHGGYNAFSLPGTNPESIVPAKAEYTVTGKLSGVEDIEIDAAEADGEPVYFNLNGVRVAADNMTPGIYVKVTGNKASKVVVR